MSVDTTCDVTFSSMDDSDDALQNVVPYIYGVVPYGKKQDVTTYPRYNPPHNQQKKFHNTYLELIIIEGDLLR